MPSSLSLVLAKLSYVYTPHTRIACRAGRDSELLQACYACDRRTSAAEGKTCAMRRDVTLLGHHRAWCCRGDRSVSQMYARIPQMSTPPCSVGAVASSCLWNGRAGDAVFFYTLFL